VLAFKELCFGDFGGLFCEKKVFLYNIICKIVVLERSVFILFFLKKLRNISQFIYRKGVGILNSFFLPLRKIINAI
jgi:hypothetical protein